eukprot:TRINITY_DN22448_c0_g1_i2.p1 TRINITY_DN22448_c0_g1~~TRINITY_DN22448_c0_g1_i2.p1  ORF type:complete len:857 (+),score=108.32 TRINITY_DN22448_c0_g1_i2:238-2808(+)
MLELFIPLLGRLLLLRCLALCGSAPSFVSGASSNGNCSCHPVLPTGILLGSSLLLPQQPTPACTTTTTTTTTTTSTNTTTTTVSTTTTTLTNTTTTTLTSTSSTSTWTNTSTSVTSSTFTTTSRTSTSTSTTFTRTTTNFTGNTTTTTSTTSTTTLSTTSTTSSTSSTTTSTTSSSTTSATNTTTTTTTLTNTSTTTSSTTTFSSTGTTTVTTMSTTLTDTSTTTSATSATLTNTTTWTTSTSSTYTETKTETTTTTTSRTVTTSTTSSTGLSQTNETSDESTQTNTSTTTMTNTSTSSSTSSTTTTSSTTSTTLPFCSNCFYGGVPVSSITNESANCTDLQNGGTCNYIVNDGMSDNSDNQSNSTSNVSLGACYTPGLAEFYCPLQQGACLHPSERNIRCKVCSFSSFFDEAEAFGQISGTVHWGPNQIGNEIDESMLDGYSVRLVDCCGAVHTEIGKTFKVLSRPPEKTACCDPRAYSLSFGPIARPQDVVSIMISPFQGGHELLGGVLIPIADSTPTPTTSSTTTLTTSTVTRTIITIVTTTRTKTTFTTTSSTTIYTPVSVTIRGCLGMNVSDPMAFVAVPDAQKAIAEVLAAACGPKVTTSMIKVNLKLGSRCSSRRLQAAMSQRRLDSGGQVTANYVIVIPPSVSGGAGAVGQNAIQALGTLIPSKVTSDLRTAMARYPSLSSFAVTVFHIGAPSLTAAISTTVAPLISADPVEEGGPGPILALVGCILVLLAACAACPLALWLRYKRDIAYADARKSAEVQRAASPQPNDLDEERNSTLQSQSARNPSLFSQAEFSNSQDDGHNEQSAKQKDFLIPVPESSARNHVEPQASDHEQPEESNGFEMGACCI